jgi:hypothetical protein
LLQLAMFRFNSAAELLSRFISPAVLSVISNAEVHS